MVQACTSQYDRIASEKTIVSILRHVQEWIPFFSYLFYALALLYICHLHNDAQFFSVPGHKL